MGFAVEDINKRLKQRDKVSLYQVKAFKDGAQQFVISILKKLFENSALASVALCSASVLDPSVMCELSKEKVTRTLETSSKPPDSSSYNSTQSMRSGYG